MKSFFVLWILFAMGSQSAAPTAPGAPFQLTIEPESASVTSGDKIVLRITLTNTSEKDLGFRQRARADEAEWDYSIEVRDEKGDAASQTNFGRNRLKMMTMFSARVKTVNPGQSLKEEVTLSKLFDLTIPGRYTVQVSRHAQDSDSGQLVKSSTATIIVTMF
jgi:hypothetical protein